MCGIVGILNFNEQKVDPRIIIQSTNMIVKRGPDDAGEWTEHNIGLGHRRLSILDLTPAGHQPMVSDDERYVIVFNGEIYNFRELRRELENNGGSWNSNSDTEVILKAYAKWGPECVTRFHGMFAIAIWDRYQKVLYAARDRMGVKPFYYHHSSLLFAFASRPKGLFPLCPGLTRSVDEQALRYYLECGYIPAPFSIYKNVFKLPPAHYLLVNEMGFSIKRYWDFRHIIPEISWERREEDDLLDELDEIISRNVRYRLISDVPLGAFLSGGIDSSLVVSMMAKHSSKPKTFTIGFKENEFDESKYALAVSEHLGTEHHCEYMKVDDLLQLLPNFLAEFDEPFFDSSAFPTMAVSRLARQYVSVSLSGDGGDELFGGYHYYRIIQKLSLFYSMPTKFRKCLSKVIGLFPEHKFQLLSGALSQKDIISAFAFSRSIKKDFKTVLLPEVITRTKGINDLFADQMFPGGLSPAEQGMRLDAFYTLPDDYLQKVDISSMGYSLESREPLLDQELVEWAMKLPLSWKLRKGQNKYLLRKLAYRYVPEKILDRPKQGFEIPVGRWLKGPLKDWAEDRCNDTNLFKNIPLDQPKVIELLKLHHSGGRNAHPMLWAVLMLLDFNL